MVDRLPRPGSLFAGRYRVESLLGEGGMGSVFAATDEKLNVACALKVVSALELTKDGARLVREARALMLISSAHVVRVFDVGSVEGLPYLVLERLEGVDLAKLVSAGPALSSAVVARYASEVCEALSAAHAVGVIHRDIKPSNLFLARRADGREILKVLDFGISKAAPGDALGSLTLPDRPLGSPQFISPEQIANPKGVDPRTDVWSLGAVMFRLLSGRFPFEGATSAALHRAIVGGRRPRLADVAPDVPPGLAEIVERCLALDREERFATAADLAAALRPFVEGPRGVPAAAAAPAPPPATSAEPVTLDAPTLVQPPLVDEATTDPEESPSAGDAPTEEVTTEAAPRTPRAPRRRKPWRWAAVAVGVAIPLGVASLTLSRRTTPEAGPAQLEAPSEATPSPSTAPPAGEPRPETAPPRAPPRAGAVSAEPAVHVHPRPHRAPPAVAATPAAQPVASAPVPPAPSTEERPPPRPASTPLRSNPYR